MVVATPINDCETIWRTRTEYDRTDVFVVLTEATAEQKEFMRDWDRVAPSFGQPHVIFEDEFSPPSP